MGVWVGRDRVSYGGRAPGRACLHCRTLGLKRPFKAQQTVLRPQDPAEGLVGGKRCCACVCVRGHTRWLVVWGGEGSPVFATICELSS